jgi:O-antigen ligase
MSTTDALALPSQFGNKMRSIFTPQFTAIVVVTLLLVTFEGLTRGTSVAYGGESDDTEFLSFGPYFAFITLPFLLAYGKSVRIGISETLLLWLMLGSVVYDKSFAYTHIPGLPGYVTDIVLGICCIDLWKRKAFRINSISKLEWLLFGLFFGAGCLAAARGVLGGEDRTKTVRDFAMVLYVVFALVSLSIFRGWDSIKRYLVFGALGAVLATINAFWWFVTVPNMRRYIPSPVYIQIVFDCVLLLKVRGWKGWKSNLLIACCAVGLLLGNARSTDLVAAVGVVGVLVASGFLWRGISWALIKGLLITVAITLLSVLLLLQTEIGHSFMVRSSEQIVSGMNYSDDPNAVFRFMAWAEAYRRFSESPVVGEGFGIPFVFALADNDPRPHNTYLTILYKMGVIGFLPFAAILFEYYRRSLVAVYRYRVRHRSTLLLLLIIIQFSFSAYGLLNLLLESPFLASLFWINLGMTGSAMLLLRGEGSNRPAQCVS